jgi:23S rRNA (adenine2503-C2)-methyltransferase
MTASVSGDNITFILNQDLPQLEASLTALGEPAYRAHQVWRWVYHRLADDFAQMTDLPHSLRERLAAIFGFDGLQPQAQQISEDGLTRKVLFRLADGNAVETVLMLYDATDSGRARRTVCVSTQVGCALGCAFCATGQGGLQRNLTAGEIVGQVLFFAREISNGGGEQAEEATGLPPLAPGQPPITNIIFAGMGEPLANYDATLGAIRRLNDAHGFRLGVRHMTVSTAGLVPGIKRLTRERLQVNLAVSLHAPTDEIRDRIMPINRGFPLAKLLPACQEYVEMTGRRIAFEYILIDGLNSLPTHARQLAALIEGMTCMVNLIPMNPVSGSGLDAPQRDTVIAFQSILDAAGITTTVRIEKGREIQAACGQLRGKQTPVAPMADTSS